MAVEPLWMEEGVCVPISRHPVAARSLLAQIAAKHAPTYQHVTRVSAYAGVFATHLRLSRREVRMVSHAALLHDVGKLEIADAILTKPGRLSDEEMPIMTEHAVTGAQILARSTALADLSETVRHHHEWYDGRGYPMGLSGEEIPLASRLIALCDAFDTMTTPRPYANPLPLAQALAELERCAGTQFDPELVADFARLGRSGGLRRGVLTHPELPGVIFRPEPLALRMAGA